MLLEYRKEKKGKIKENAYLAMQEDNAEINFLIENDSI